jgi:hypothetical protein
VALRGRDLETFSRDRMAPSNPRAVLHSLIGLALALLLVGVVSGTILRHVVQILPIVIAAAVLLRRRNLGLRRAQRKVRTTVTHYDMPPLTPR